MDRLEQRNLTKARDLLAKGFCKNHMAETSEGVTIDPQDRQASRFCVWGALERAYGGPHKDLTKAVSALYKHVPDSFKEEAERQSFPIMFPITALVNFNNASKTTQADMTALFDKALAA